MSDKNDKSPSALPEKLSLRRERIKVLRVRSELRTGAECENNTCALDSKPISCTSLTTSGAIRIV